MNDYGFELTADEAKQYEENKAAVDAEFETLVKNAQNQRLEQSGSLGFSAEDHRALFTEALANVASGVQSERNEDSDTQPSLIAPSQKDAGEKNTAPSTATKTTSYTSTTKTAKGK